MIVVVVVLVAAYLLLKGQEGAATSAGEPNGTVDTEGNGFSGAPVPPMSSTGGGGPLSGLTSPFGAPAAPTYSPTGAGAGASAASPAGKGGIFSRIAAALQPSAKRSGGFARATLYTGKSTNAGGGIPRYAGAEAPRGSTLTGKGLGRTAGRGTALAGSSKNYRGNLGFWKRYQGPSITGG